MRRLVTELRRLVELYIPQKPTMSRVPAETEIKVYQEPLGPSQSGGLLHALPEKVYPTKRKAMFAGLEWAYARELEQYGSMPTVAGVMAQGRGWVPVVSNYVGS